MPTTYAPWLKEMPQKNSIFARLYNKLIYEKGFSAVMDDYFCGKNETVFNRSRGAESNFFVFVKDFGNRLNLIFTNPIEDSTSFEVKRENILIKLEISSEAQVADVVDKIAYFSKYKEENVYRCFLHSHLGYINGGAIWGDGITKDRNWIRQSMLWNCDFHALTEHNWTQNEERLGFLNEKCAAAGIVFVPGWENTTTVEDLIISPHLLVYCADIDVAMRMKAEFLIKKLQKKVGLVTPVLCGVPLPFEEQIEFLRKHQERGEIFVVVAHPFSTLPGIDLFDPEIIHKLGYNKIWDVLGFAKGVEMYNGSEVHCKLNFDFSDGLMDRHSDVAEDLKKRLIFNGLNPYFSPPMLNFLIGKIMKKAGKWTVYGHDDHYVPDIDKNHVGLYGQGHTDYVLTQNTFQKLVFKGRKPTSREFVQSCATGKFSDGEDVSLEAVAYARMTEKGPEVVDERKPSFFGRILEKIEVAPAYYGRIVMLQLKYWLADKKQKEEFAKELEKARSYNLRPR